MIAHITHPQSRATADAQSVDEITLDIPRSRLADGVIALHRQMVHQAIMDLSLDPNVNHGANWPHIRSAFHWLSAVTHNPDCLCSACRADGQVAFSLEYSCHIISVATGKPFNAQYIQHLCSHLMRFVGRQIGKHDKVKALPTLVPLRHKRTRT